ncbi:Negative elongation factor C/D [Mortierella polycephala]|uniref:Negative elongation factor C/D n=1 Tax=Mortierella polycephala TaxID=41804 RepID=A0A9P6QGG9_9FUNG|nr:Negative elongation factor C/D [Mortierella polycephala]
MSTKNATGASGQAGSNSNLDSLMKSLQAPDSILEPTIVDTIGIFLNSGGSPLQLVNTLPSSYVGVPEMCNLMSGWAREFDIDPVEVMQEALKEQLMDRFDPESVDKQFMMSGSETPHFLKTMIQHPFWRSVIYELSEKHQKCQLLNYAIQSISDAGYQGEIASVATASTFVKVFSGVLLDSLDKLREEDDVGLLDRLPDLVCNLRNSTVADSFPWRRYADETMLFKTYQLHRAYSSNDPPSAYFLRDPDFFEIMLSSIFVPSFKGGIVKQDHKDKYLWLMAYAAGVHENDDMTTDTTEVQQTYEALNLLDDTLSKRTAGTDLTPILHNLLIAIETPVASMALMYWIKFVIMETSYIESYFRSHEVPVPLLLIEEMAYKHSLQQTAVFATLVDFFEAPLELNPEIMMTYRKSILDRMIYLMQLNYVMPVLDYIRMRASKMDQSLSMHFVKRVLELVHGPYSRKFVEGIGQMIQEIVEVIKKTDAETVVRTWIDEVVSQPIEIDIQTTPPAPGASATQEVSSSLTEAGLSAIQDLKRRLDEPRK